MLFIITIAQRLVNLVLPTYVKTGVGSKGAMDGVQEEFDFFDDMWHKKYIKPIGLALMLTAAIAGISFLLSRFFPDSFKVASIILMITTFAIIASFSSKVRTLDKTFQAGMYLILVFCLLLGRWPMYPNSPCNPFISCITSFW
jgi:hypothetical protein